MREIEASLVQIRNAWIAGRSALEQAPASWREAIGGVDELALVALAGHATDVLTRNEPAAPLVDRPMLPTLSSPLVPDALRPRFRRLLAAPKKLPSLERHLIAFVAARGYATHPADWMPDAKDDWAPDLYAPWLNWVRAEARVTPSTSEITVENYDEWTWTERRAALWALRAHDPTAARTIIAAKAAGEPAERRIRLVELFDNGLSVADAEFLESLAGDRSDRVQALARTFLARLGRNSDNTASTGLATELAAMVELNKVGPLNRRIQLALKPLKTGAQTARRRDLFRLVSLSELARALEVSELQLVECALGGPVGDLLDFTACVGATGSDAAVRALVEQLLENSDTPAVLLRPLAERLAPAERDAMLPQLMARDSDLFETTLSISGASLGRTPLMALTASPNYATLKTKAEILTRGDDAGRTAAMRTLELLLPRVGLLLDAASARALLEQIAAWDLSSAEPRLDVLHFNAALTPETAP